MTDSTEVSLSGGCSTVTFPTASSSPHAKSAGISCREVASRTASSSVALLLQPKHLLDCRSYHPKHERRQRRLLYLLATHHLSNCLHRRRYHQHVHETTDVSFGISLNNLFSEATFSSFFFRFAAPDKCFRPLSRLRVALFFMIINKMQS